MDYTSPGKQKKIQEKNMIKADASLQCNFQYGENERDENQQTNKKIHQNLLAQLHQTDSGLIKNQ